MCYLGNALMENRNGLLVDGRVTHAIGQTAEPSAVSMAAALKASHSHSLGVSII